MFGLVSDQDVRRVGKRKPLHRNRRGRWFRWNL